LRTVRNQIQNSLRHAKVPRAFTAPENLRRNK
jgi:hypothetical protein